jgi:hypothetical protein
LADSKIKNGNKKYKNISVLRDQVVTLIPATKNCEKNPSPNGFAVFNSVVDSRKTI